MTIALGAYSVSVISKNRSSEFCETESNQIISLQSEWFATPDTAIAERGFLATVFTPSELEVLFNDGATFFLLKFDDELIGFALTSPIRYFTLQFLNSFGSHFVSGVPIQFSDLVYLYQLAVKKGWDRKGVGKKLLNEVFSVHQETILADLLIAPVLNKPSLRFFESAGFLKVGELILRNYRNFGTLTSGVYIDSRHASQK